MVEKLLTQFIKVIVKVHAEGKSQVLCGRVNINDKIVDQLTPLITNAYESGGKLVTKGGPVNKDDTFSALYIKENTTFISAGGS